MRKLILIFVGLLLKFSSENYAYINLLKCIFDVYRMCIFFIDLALTKRLVKHTSFVYMFIIDGLPEFYNEGRFLCRM